MKRTYGSKPPSGRRSGVRGACVGALLLSASCQTIEPFLVSSNSITVKASRTGCSETNTSQMVALTAEGAGEDQTYHWYFTDGTVLHGQRVVHVFPDLGKFNVTLDVGSEKIQTSVFVPMRGALDGFPDAFGDRCVPNEGNVHVPVDTTVTYRTNPPASGGHYNAAGVSPAAPGVYDDEPVRPEVWVHNLEHGHVVILFECDGDCPGEFLRQLDSLLIAAPRSRFGNKKIVITRYPGLPVKVMAVAWDYQRDFDSVDLEGLLAFYARHVDQGPELEP